MPEAIRAEPSWEAIRRPLGPGVNMYYREFSPAAGLKPYIRSYLHLRATGKRFQQPADGCPGMMINIGEPFVLGVENGSVDVGTGCLVFGPSTRWLSTTHLGQTNLLIVKFEPGRLSHLFGVPAIELTDKSAALESLWGKSGRDFEQLLADGETLSEIRRLLDEIFLSRLSLHPGTQDARIPMILSFISSRKGQIHIEDLAGRFDLSRRQLERIFADSVGLTPKRMCRTARFSSAVSHATTCKELDWAELAYAHAYSDQAHLVRECKYFTGYSPVSYLKNRSAPQPSVRCTVRTIPHRPIDRQDPYHTVQTISDRIAG